MGCLLGVGQEFLLPSRSARDGKKIDEKNEDIRNVKSFICDLEESHMKKVHD